jgi:hypothetical protein
MRVAIVWTSQPLVHGSNSSRQHREASTFADITGAIKGVAAGFRCSLACLTSRPQ